MLALKNFPVIILGIDTMSKGQKGNKEDKKKPVMTPKEKKAAKKEKKNSPGFLRKEP